MNNATLINEAAVKEQIQKKKHLIGVALGEEQADVILKNVSFVNVFTDEIEQGDISICEGKIASTKSGGKAFCEYDLSGLIAVPALIDSHIHIESSMLTPAGFAEAVTPHGTACVVTDPHEIANVLGLDGIYYMMQQSRGLTVDVMFMLPSCVPATGFEVSGAVLNAADLVPLYSEKNVLGLAEMMNYVGVINKDENVLEKIVSAQLHHKKIDGHAPNLTNRELDAYISAGVYSDHEATCFSEGLEKIRKGQYLMIREGTAAKNLEALVSLLAPKYNSRVMLATDDKHPNDLIEKGHMDHILRKAVNLGCDPIMAVKAATLNPARYFLMNDRGAIAPGLRADITVFDNLKDFNVVYVFKDGKLVYPQKTNKALKPIGSSALREKAIDSFNLRPLSADDFCTDDPLKVIRLINGQITTSYEGEYLPSPAGAPPVKAAVIERYSGNAQKALCVIEGYGIRCGAVATSISHDSHNLIVIGDNAEDMAKAANAVIEAKGGISVVSKGGLKALLPLPVAGLMSEQPLFAVNEQLEKAKQAAHSLGVETQIDPFMTLSFLSLSVIPEARLTVYGVVDAATQKLL